MAYGNQFKSAVLGGASFGDTYTTEQYPLGTIRVQLADEVEAETHTDGTTALGLKGDRTWIFVRAIAAIAAYECCIVSAADTATTSFGVIRSDATDDVEMDVVGIAQDAIAITSYGWIVCHGECVANGASGLGAGEEVGTLAGGLVEGSTTAGARIGKCLSALGTPVASTVRLRLRLP